MTERAALSVDFGTSFTSAAVRMAGTTRPLTFPDGHTRISSAVLRLPDGSLAVGIEAEAQAALHVDAFEPTPKRRIGAAVVDLGGHDVEVVDLVAAVLRRVVHEAHRQYGDQLDVVLTHPAEWQSTRKAVLVEAARRAALEGPSLVPEPVAAATTYATDHDVPVGGNVAVYDLGGGTFDVAVVTRTADGWELAGPPAGIDPLGGVDFDHLLYRHLVDEIAGRHPEAAAHLTDPPDMAWRRRTRELLNEARRTKEALSSNETSAAIVPGADAAVTVTRRRFEELIAPLVDRTVDLLRSTVSAADLSTGELVDVYLTGGSARIPLVADRVRTAMGREPSCRDDPKLVVAIGAIRAAGSRPDAATEPTEPLETVSAGDTAPIPKIPDPPPERDDHATARTETVTDEREREDSGRSTRVLVGAIAAVAIAVLLGAVALAGGGSGGSSASSSGGPISDDDGPSTTRGTTTSASTTEPIVPGGPSAAELRSWLGLSEDECVDGGPGVLDPHAEISCTAVAGGITVDIHAQGWATTPPSSFLDAALSPEQVYDDTRWTERYGGAWTGDYVTGITAGSTPFVYWTDDGLGASAYIVTDDGSEELRFGWSEAFLDASSPPSQDALIDQIPYIRESDDPCVANPYVFLEVESRLTGGWWCRVDMAGTVTNVYYDAYRSASEAEDQIQQAVDGIDGLEVISREQWTFDGRPAGEFLHYRSPAGESVLWQFAGTPFLAYAGQIPSYDAFLDFFAAGGSGSG